DVLTRGEKGSAHRTRRAELIERFELDPSKRGRTYSKGNRQKVSLIAALSRDVDLYIMDEPTSGLDPLMEAIFTDEVRALKERGRTVLLSSHILAEVEKLCDTVTIIRAGRDVESGTLAQLRHLTRSTVAASTDADPSDLETMDGVHDLEAGQGRLRFDVDDATAHDVLPALATMGATNLTITPPSLEHPFLRHYGADLPVRPPVAAPPDASPSDLETMDGAHGLEAGQGRLRFDVDDATVHDVLPALATMGATNLTITPPSLEDLFLRHYGDDLPVTEDE